MPSLRPSGADALRVHQKLLAARRCQRTADFQLAMLLVEMADGRLFLDLGYASLTNYAEEVLELSARTTRELLLLARRLPDLPVLCASLASGQLDWTKAREVARVATPKTEAAWVARAAKLTSRGLEAEVAASLVGELPVPGAPERERRPARQRVVFEMESADAEVLRATLVALRAVTHVGHGDAPNDGVLLAGMARRVLAAMEEERAQEHAGADSGPTGERYRVVLEHCPRCRRTVAPDAEVSDTVAQEAMCDAELLEMRPGPDQGHVTRAVPEVEGFFGILGKQSLSEAVSPSKKAPREPTRAYMRYRNKSPTPVAWRKPAQAILNSHRRMLDRISTAVH